LVLALMRSLLGSWPAVAERVRQAPSIVLFLDFDGTLAPLVKRPQDATPGRAMRSVLVKLAANPRVRVCIISGRGRSDLRARVGVSGAYYLGVHGWDRHGRTHLSQAAALRLASARQELEERLKGAPGVRVEDKNVALAVHYRGAFGSAIVRAGALVGEVLGRSGGMLRALAGDLVWEVLPTEIRGKGHAVRQLRNLCGRSALPIYVGNDGTDEAAFEALSEGITARVGRARLSRARFFLRDITQVREFLEKLSGIA
jgi:trehalose-phosphatase